MNWMKQINEVIEYIEANLEGDINNDEIALLANCSIYNFQRMFSYIADKSLSSYIRERRLTKAGVAVQHTKESIGTIANCYGYDSQDSFARAFKKFHGVLPSEARKAPHSLRSTSKLHFELTVKGDFNMNYSIEDWPQFSIAGFIHKLDKETIYQSVPQVWETLWRSKQIEQLIELFKQTDYRPAGFIGSSIHDSENTVDYLTGVTNYVDAPDVCYAAPLAGMEEVTIPASTWIIITANGKLPEATQLLYQQFYSEWLPSSDYVLCDIPIIESYMQNDRQEIWVAIKKAGDRT
ncbi:AraC family transcriptional regulator [Enterococcus sp. LJL51]|uniref:AraC family transcriptional regulator n=1 Tax=Enterococcus sp. LJL51 TaxID=3416656 RepID=UPI003CED2FE1